MTSEGSSILWYELQNSTSGKILGGAANYTAAQVSTAVSKMIYISDEVPVNKWPGRHYYGTYAPGDFNLWISDADGSNSTFQYGPEPIDVDVRIYFNAPYTPGSIDPSQDLAWSPNRSLVAYVADNSAVGQALFLWDVTSWASAQVGPMMDNSTQPSWSPDNVDLAFCALSGGHFHIFVLDTTDSIMPMPVGY